jgi:hypothetical protein
VFFIWLSAKPSLLSVRKKRSAKPPALGKEVNSGTDAATELTTVQLESLFFVLPPDSQQKTLSHWHHQSTMMNSTGQSQNRRCYA